MGPLPSRAQDAADHASSDDPYTSFTLDAEPVEPEPPGMTSLVPVLPSYGGDLAQRSHLTGDWGGGRTWLAEKGITFEVELVQILQANISGGLDTSRGPRYSGSADYYLRFDTARMGLWPAGQLLLHGETQFGRSVNPLVGAGMPPNTDALLPLIEDPGVTTLTQVWYTQFLSEKFGFALGKGDFRGADQTAFAHDERVQFMNLAFLANPVLLNIGTYSSLRVGVFYRPVDWLSVRFTVLDPYGSPTRVGFDTAFHAPNGAMFYNEWVANVRPFGLPGHQRIGLVYSTQDFNLLDQQPSPSQRNLPNRRPKTTTDDWAFVYNFDQYLYTEVEDPTQGVGIFGRFGYSNGEANPISTFYSVGVSGTGVIPTRDEDTFGIGYYFLKFSDELPAVLGLTAEQGIEFYYRFQVTPWLHVSPDIQYIFDPSQASDSDHALVVGLRTNLKF